MLQFGEIAELTVLSTNREFITLDAQELGHIQLAAEQAPW